MTRAKQVERGTIRCAVYTRKSTEAGLEQEFNSLDAQREAGQAFIRSQAHEGWTCIDEHYDDGGYTGGNMDRPALQRLLSDIDAGLVDCVVVYKIDRLSRSLLDFSRIVEAFDRHGVSFVSVTQQFNTANSMGRLMLNVLLSFAQFEREIIGERTRDKIAATRRKGKWCGGHPILGYDVDPRGFRLVVNHDEAVRVRRIFELYLEHQSLLGVVQELERLGWRTKCWTTRRNGTRGGRPFTTTNLHKLLTNAAYIGKVRYKTELHDGEHEAIVTPEVWQRVQALLSRNGRTGGALARNKFGALLKGLLHCAPCGCAMTPAHSTKNGSKRYRYYVCTSAQKRGWSQCPSKSIPAHAIERFVVDRIKGIGQDEKLLEATILSARAQRETRLEEIAGERRGLERELKGLHADLREQALSDGLALNIARLADLQERIRTLERRQSELAGEEEMQRQGLIDGEEVARALADFTAVWEALTPAEQVRLVGLLVERVEYDGAKGKVSITFHETGIDGLTTKQRVKAC